MKYLFSIILALTLTASIAYAEKVFTDEDLKKFNVPPISEGKSPIETSPANTGGQQVQQNKEGPQFWCNRALELKNKISSARVAYDQAVKEKIQADRNHLNIGSPQAREAAASRLSQTEVAVQAAESELRDLEDDAHRQDIPPGWLRCQFE